MLNDAKERLLATDPTQSFIVQAPAGSGKTEILTQRYLRLLGTVCAPEQIVALTFTRKAANEMRERVLAVFREIASGTPATTPHREQTHAYAKIALAQDKAKNWQLLQQPSRLRILTIDALCQTIATAIPLQEQQIPFAQITDKPYIHYLNAAKQCMDYAIKTQAYQPSIRTLLEHLDNRQDLLLNLLSELLATRDQWLTHFYQAKAQDKQTFEHALRLIEQHELQRFRESTPIELRDELVSLARLVANIETTPNSPRAPLRNWESFEALDGKMATSLSALLLTSTNTLRKAFDHHIGLKRGSCEDEVYETLKSASKKLLNQLELLKDFLPALVRIKNLPNPQYSNSQWAVLQALFNILPLLAAHLHLVFCRHLEVDFTAVALKALQALGEEGSPTDLALYLDNRIHHLLVDEFQDTSIQQFELLSRLVQGFQPHDGKTIFIVGDPMQSIYRFRAAEVGLFLRAKQHGIGPVSLTPLELSSNFRSTPVIIDWINQRFRAIFPAQNDIESGAISFHPSISTRISEDDFVKAHQYETEEQEAIGLMQVVKEELANYPHATIAILVRSRNQLQSIVSALKKEHIPFQGVDIDLLANLPHLRDVYSLTEALLSPANRLAWLSFLRSPWCGLALNDLHVIANFAKHQSIYEALSQITQLTELSDEGRVRAEFVYQVLHQALANRHQQPLTHWLRDTLEKLHIKHILNEEEEHDLEQYWLLLDQFETAGQLNDLIQFKEEFNKLYSQISTPARLQIMTIHKSKGLEFDCVILPGLSRKSRNKDSKLLRFLKIPTHQYDELLLLSPIKAAYEEYCALSDYVNKIEQEKNLYEQQRLLYVAVTRAKSRLYLFDNRLKGESGSFRDMLHHQTFEDKSKALDELETTFKSPLLYRLPIHFYETPLPEFIPSYSLLTINENDTPRLIGIVIHELLQWICTYHPKTIHEIPWDMSTRKLASFGLTQDDLKLAREIIKKQITDFFENPIGQWIAKHHQDEKNEYECLVEHEGEIITRIIDRTFFENDTRWIIDFKTGIESPEVEKIHRQQVDEYAALFSNTTSNKIWCGLYYLESGHWIKWSYLKASSNTQKQESSLFLF